MIVLTVLTMVVLLALTGFAVDVGRAYLVQRQLQAATDAAVLAAALELPSAASATRTASVYGPLAGGRNAVPGTSPATMDVTLRCIVSAPGCQPGSSTYNAISVTSRSSVATVFAQLVGIDSLPVNASATACSPCRARPLDIELVLDRTGSMCEISNGVPDPSCAKLANARNGILTFLRLLDPRYDRVGLAVLPPATGTSREAQCSVPTVENYDAPGARYTIVPLSSDYATAPGTLNATSTLIDRLGCQRAGGRTGYANAIEAARGELLLRGRPGVQKVIVFLSDGAANYGPLASPPSYRLQPCRQGIAAAAAAKASNILVYSIGYDLNGSTSTYEPCKQNDYTILESPPMNALEAMQAIATSPQTFYNQPDPVQLNTIFTQIASSVSRTSSLIDDSLP